MSILRERRVGAYHHEEHYAKFNQTKECMQANWNNTDHSHSLWTNFTF